MAAVAGRQRRGRRKLTDRMMPAVYAVVPLLVVAFILPSALRPPPQTTQSGAEYSPDAPPNSKAQTITKTQFQPGSNTAGQQGAHTPPPTPSPTPTLPSGASTVGCSGPLQWPSVYTVPCEASYTGDNGGSTFPGVTATKINVVVSFFGQQQTDGIIDDTTAQSSQQLRTLNDIQKYFNSHAMMYNRTIQLYYATEASATDQESNQRSDVDNAVSKYHPIAAMVEGTPPEIDQYTKDHIVTDHWETFEEKFIESEAPYAWGQNGPTDDAKLGAEWICKQLKGYPPIRTATTGLATYDPTKPRKFGSIEGNLAYFNTGPTLLAGLKSCGVSSLDQAVGIDRSDDIQNALLKDQNAGVTSIILNIDLVDDLIIMEQAKSINYFPEWITDGWGGFDQDAYLMRDGTSDELSNTFGLSTTEINKSPNDMECYRAVASVDSGFVAHPLYCHIYWEMLSHLVDAIELNGPKLTGPSLAKTYYTIPAVPVSAANNWAMYGNYGAHHRSWADAATVYWWDANDIDADGGTGTYAYGDCAQRFLAGTIPTHPAHIFTKAGFVTGPTFGHKCTPPSSSSSGGAAVTEEPFAFAAGLPLVVPQRRAIPSSAVLW
jgi:hypothetical protein